MVNSFFSLFAHRKLGLIPLRSLQTRSPPSSLIVNSVSSLFADCSLGFDNAAMASPCFDSGLGRR